MPDSRSKAVPEFNPMHGYHKPARCNVETQSPQSLLMFELASRRMDVTWM